MIQTDTHPAPRLARIEAVNGEASAFYSFCKGLPFAFDLQEKVRQAQTFSIKADGSSFAIPTKLVGTSKFQPTLAAVGAVPHTYRKLVARFVPDIRAGRAGDYRLALYFGGDLLGFVQDKHLPWIEALIPSRDFCMTGVQFYALAVTGGEPGKPTRGLNLIITGTGERAALLLDHAVDRAAAEAEVEAAYEAGRLVI